jgi:hypothetical protein
VKTKSAQCSITASNHNPPKSAKIHRGECPKRNEGDEKKGEKINITHNKQHFI